MRRALVFIVMGTTLSLSAQSADSASQAGTTILGDQDAAVGLFLAPWKDETRADFARPPGLQDQIPTPGDAAGYARVTEYYAAGRAYRAERLQRNR